MSRVTAKGPYGYARSHRYLEILGIALFAVFEAYLVARLVASVEGPAEAVGLCLAVVGGFLLADFVTGLAHWAGDTLGTERTFLVGPNFVRPFRHHHTDPKDITRHDFVETNGNNCLVTVPWQAGVYAVLPETAGMTFWGCAVVVFGALFVMVTNQIHKWAHMDRPPVLVRPLQRWGIVLSPEHHERHHTPPHDSYYCITAGWLNPLLTRVRFFRMLERAVALVRPGILHLEERKALAAARLKETAATAAALGVGPAEAPPAPGVGS